MKTNTRTLAVAAIAGIFAVGAASARGIHTEMDHSQGITSEKGKCSGKDGCKGKEKKKEGDKEKCTGKDGCSGKEKKEGTVL